MWVRPRIWSADLPNITVAAITSRDVSGGEVALVASRQCATMVLALFMLRSLSAD